MSGLSRQPGYSAAALFALLEKQVKRYHACYHMGNNSSVPVETARELLQSVQYSLDIAGEGGDIDAALERGQGILEKRLERARRLHRLVTATAPENQSQWRWEAADSLRKYLDTYDYRHFAHRVPQWLDYPLLTRIPEELRGIDYAAFYLNCLWMENRILNSFAPETREELYAALPPDYWEAPENDCEQLLWNAAGRQLLGLPPDSLPFSEEQRQRIGSLYTPERLTGAMETVCRKLGLQDDTAAYAGKTLDRLLPLCDAAARAGALSMIFV